MRVNKQSGQGLVEFALVVPIFLALMAGLFDGCRLLFTYNELQESARVAARFGAVEVNRDSWGNFRNTSGNSGTSWASQYAGTQTIVGEAAGKLVAVDKNQTRVVITLPAAGYTGCENSTTGEQGTAVGLCTGMPVAVSVSYQFRPVLGFGVMGITLTGKAAQDHE